VSEESTIILTDLSPPVGGLL